MSTTNMLIYRVSVLGRNARRNVESCIAVPQEVYDEPSLRLEAERRAQEQLRHVEGVTPDMPFTEEGWQEIVLSDQEHTP